MTDNRANDRPAFGAIVLAAGKGTRMRSTLPKVLHPVGGKPMIHHVLDGLAGLGAARLAVVVGPQHDSLRQAIAPTPSAVQAEPLGTGHAALAAAGLFQGFVGDVFVLFGDTPLIRPETLQAMLDRRNAADRPTIVALGMRPADLAAYGRLILNDAGEVERIVEARDASPAERAVDLCNSGAMLVDGARLFDLLARVRSDNAKGEYYLTDIVGLARADGDRAVVVEGSERELLGVNDRVDLAAAEAEYQRGRRQAAMLGGATLIAPETVFFAHDARVEPDALIEPNVVLGPGAHIEGGAVVRAFSHVEGARVRAGAVIGPYARLRPGADIGEGAHIGNFVEVKATTVEAGAKANHLAYLGDARVGAGANIGAGTITCNYDGFGKHRTDIGAGAFIGSNSALVAPVSIGDGAIVGAGSAISRNVPANALALTRADQTNRPGWAEAFRARRRRRDPATDGADGAAGKASDTGSGSNTKPLSKKA